MVFITSFIKKSLKWIISLLGLLLVWVISLFICLGIIVFFGEAWGLAHNSLTAQGSVIRVDSCQLSSNNQYQRYGWRPYVQFHDANDNTYQGEGYGTICHHLYEPIYTTVTVHYLVQDPTFFTVETTDSPLISVFLYGILCSLWMLVLLCIITPVWLWVTFSPEPKKIVKKMTATSNERLTKIGNFSTNEYAQALVYQPDKRHWWLSSLSEERKFSWLDVGDTSGFGNLQDGRPFWVGNFSDSDGRSQILFYTLRDSNWWLSSLTDEHKFAWKLVANTSGFGNLQDGRPFWVGNFSDPDSNGRSQILFYAPSDHNWWLSSLTEEGKFAWKLVADTSGFGNLQDGRPFWVGNFSDPDWRSQILFYAPSDHNWWLSSFTDEGKFAWKLVADTSGFGNLQDGRPFWVGNFSDSDGRSQILFYAPNDHNWWLSSLTDEGQFAWKLVADTSGFGNLQDGRPFWVGNFSDSNGRSQILFYAPNDRNWWLSSLTDEGKFVWKLVADTSGFGNLQGGRPFWVGNFSDSNGRSQILFYTPRDRNWWLSSLTDEGQFVWLNVANF